MAVARRTCPGWLATSSPAAYRLAGDDLEEVLHHVEPAPAGLAGSAENEVVIFTGTGDKWLAGVDASSFQRPVRDWPGVRTVF
jgi:hypothetical protein